jgi:hypothetical protein
VTRNPATFGQKNPLTPPTATPTTPSVTVVTTLRRRNVPNSNYYYEKNFDSQKIKKSLKEEKIYVKLNKSQPNMKLRRMNSFLAQRVRKTTMTIMIRKKKT